MEDDTTQTFFSSIKQSNKWVIKYFSLFTLSKAAFASRNFDGKKSSKSTTIVQTTWLARSLNTVKYVIKLRFLTFDLQKESQKNKI